ncbi:hypothetical protein MMC31_004125 [Peltigera leucophlebia]|nr:hypothetical protein [Peltigera leucophlebia]
MSLAARLEHPTKNRIHHELAGNGYEYFNTMRLPERLSLRVKMSLAIDERSIDVRQTRPIPWSWAITPLDLSDHHCPQSPQILGSFAIINACVSAIAPLLGHRKVVNYLSCGALGKAHSQSWKYLWILQVILQLGANALCALMVINSPGYITYKMPAVWDLMLFYTTRPRIAWMVLGALKGVGRSRSDPTAGYWESVGRSSFISEIVLECIGTYYMGRTAHWAHLKRYYILHHLDGYVHRKSILQMIIGALVYLVNLVGNIFILWSSAKAEIDGDRKAGLKALVHFLAEIFALAWATSVSFVSSWVFMAGYVQLAGPK